MQQLLSVVVPCYNEQEVIEETHAQLVRELEAIAARHDLRYEIIYVNDGSRDRTLGLLQKIHASHTSGRGKVRIAALARNFGHQLALSAGLFQAEGDAIVAIDADLQDPPAVIGEMVARWKDGADVAYGVRETREGETFFKLLSAKLFYLTVRRLTRIDIPLDTGDFRLMSRRALDIFKSMPERHRFIRGMIPWIGLKQIAVPYKRAARFAGETKYPLSKMITLALDGITSFSNAPLRAAYLMGFGVAFVSLLAALGLIIARLAFGNPTPGWTTLMVVILFLGAIQLVTVGILGDYLGRIYDQVKQRPLFILDDRESRL